MALGDLIDEPYRRVSAAESNWIERGRICWGRVLYLPPPAQSVAVSYNPDERRNVYRLTARDEDDPARFDHPPVHEIRLRRNEDMSVIKGKERPVVVLSQGYLDWAHGGNRLSERGVAARPCTACATVPALNFSEG